MKLPLQEPRYARYLYLSPENKVHIFMPVVGGTDIGLDNTCKAVYALQEFFDKGSTSNQKTTLKGALLAYKESLENDINLLAADSPLTPQKQARVAQINTYLEVIAHLEHHAELDCLNKMSPNYPRPLEVMMQDKPSSNLHSIILRPQFQDGYLRSEAAAPLFSVAHDSESRNRFNTVSVLQQELIKAYQKLSFKPQGVKAQLIERVLALKFDHTNFELLKKHLHEEAKAFMGLDIDFNKDSYGNVLTQAFVDEDLLCGEAPTPEVYLDTLFDGCALESLKTYIESPFNRFDKAEQWSIATQFLLGITSLYCVSQSKMGPDINWGKLLDESQELSQSLALAMAGAQINQQNPEEQLRKWINDHPHLLGLNAPLSLEDINIIKRDFAVRYVQIKDSPHFDEFFLLDTQKKGTFVIHQGSIGASFAEFATSVMFDLPQHLASQLEPICMDFRALETVEIPHKNALIQENVELDIARMDNLALQALYEHIITYKDPKTKEQLLGQLKQERPDFKPKIDAKHFLQCVAYGQQDEAESLLQKDKNLAQGLLTARKTPFTDYSGRTFTCSAYEYAYWAKDTHMCRMLEKHMDHHTKQELLKRVLKMEELNGDTLIKQPRGLAYTDKNGVPHRSAHFNLTPLTQALKGYIDEHTQTPREDRARLIAPWIKIGLLQRDVPVHIAQEYCHPDRSFRDVSKYPSLLDAANPQNMKRQLEFFNLETYDFDSWFTPDSYSTGEGLGSSFAMVRAESGSASGRGELVGGTHGGVVEIDLSAIEAIDKVRTADLKQSLANLESSSSLQATPSRGS